MLPATQWGERQEPSPWLHLQIRVGPSPPAPQPRAGTHDRCPRRLKKLPSKVLDDMDDDDDLSTDGGSLYEAPLSYTFPKDATSQL